MFHPCFIRQGGMGFISKVTANRISYNSAISACERGSQLPMALDLMEAQMDQDAGWIFHYYMYLCIILYSIITTLLFLFI